MSTDVGAIILCLLGSAFFSASETALTSLPLTRLEALRERSGRLTRRGLDRWAAAPRRLLITILVGNNLVNVLASALATKISYRLTASSSLASVVGIMTLVILIFGEITPKSVAQVHAAGISRRVAAPLYLLDIVLYPITWALGLLAGLLTRREGPPVPVTEQDLLFMLRLAHHHAQLPGNARDMIESVLRFNDTIAREIMVPRPLVHTVDRSWSLERVRETVRASGYSRYPVIDGSPDAVVGILHAKLLLGLDPVRPWQALIAEPVFIPETRPLPALLQDFRRTGQHLAIVLDEFGGVAGVVSLEDALEMVVGEIEDEFDLRRADGIVAVEGGWIVPGHLSLRRLEPLLRRSLEQPEDVDSVGGLVAGLRAAPGQRVVTWDGLHLEILEEDDGRPVRIRVSPLPTGSGLKDA